MSILIRTDDVAAEDRFAYYKDLVANTQVPLDLRSDDPSVFNVRMSQTTLGEFTIVWLSSRTLSPYQVYRSKAMIRKSDPEVYRVVLNARGASGLQHNGHQALFEPRDLGLYDTSQPFDGWRGPGDHDNDWVMLTFPRTLLPLHAKSVRVTLGALLPGRQGIGALFGDVMTRIATDADQYRPADALRLSTTVLDLLTMLIAQRADVLGSVSPESYRRVRLVRIKAFIEQRLGDPNLSPNMIAAANHISIRHLHTLFYEESTTVNGWVRTRRLERFRHDLADPLLTAVPIHVIGARWGVLDASHLCRIFRAAYKTSPHQYRLMHAMHPQA